MRRAAVIVLLVVHGLACGEATAPPEEIGPQAPPYDLTGLYDGWLQLFIMDTTKVCSGPILDCIYPSLAAYDCSIELDLIMTDSAHLVGSLRVLGGRPDRDSTMLDCPPVAAALIAADTSGLWMPVEHQGVIIGWRGVWSSLRIANTLVEGISACTPVLIDYGLVIYLWEDSYILQGRLGFPPGRGRGQEPERELTCGGKRANVWLDFEVEALRNW